MTTPVPERLIQLDRKAQGLLRETEALIAAYEALAQRRLPATTKENVKNALAQLRAARQSLRNACEVFLGDSP